MNLVDHARYELERAGLFDKDSDYEGLTGNAVMELVDIFSQQGHSGFSAMLVLGIFHKVAQYETLTDLTNHPDEWMDRTEENSGSALWQSRRNPAMFSNNGGMSYWHCDHKDDLIESDNVRHFVAGMQTVEVFFT